MAVRKLATKYVEKPWGRDSLPPPFDHGKSGRMGEVWFDGPDGMRPDLLVKYIFTSERLSIQVHPNDVEGQQRGLPGGKEECWYILDAEPGATLGIGTRWPLNGEELRAAALDGSIEAVVDWKPVAPGDFFFIPAGTVHAIGAGISLVEVQQNVDVTYRLYDYGRPRELHLDDGVAVSGARPYDRALVNLHDVTQSDLLDRNEAPFTLALKSFGRQETLVIGSAEAGWFVPLSGRGTIDGQPWAAGECFLLDGAAELVSEEPGRALIATL